MGYYNKLLLFGIILFIISKYNVIKAIYQEVLTGFKLIKNIQQQYECNKKERSEKESKHLEEYYEKFETTELKILVQFFSQIQTKVISLCTLKKIRKETDCNVKRIMLQDTNALSITKYFLLIYTLTFLRCFLKIKIIVIGRHVFGEEKKKNSLYNYNEISFDISKKSFKLLLSSFSLWKPTKLIELKEIIYQRVRTSITKIPLEQDIKFFNLKKLINKSKSGFNNWLFINQHYDLFIIELLNIKKINLREIEFLEMYGEVSKIIKLISFQILTRDILEETFSVFEEKIGKKIKNKKLCFAKITIFLEKIHYSPIQPSFLINIIGSLSKLQKYCHIIFFQKI